MPGLKNTVVIPNGIDLDRFYNASAAPRSEMGFSKSDIIVLMVGAFRYEKNQSALIQTMSHLPVNYKLLLVGNGPMLNTVKYLAQKINVKDRVIFLGEVHYIERVMKMADVYVLPSISEGFGLSAVEAAASGLPVVFSNVPGLNSVFKSYGIPVDVDKPENIATGILKIINTTKNLEEISLAAKRFAKQFDINETFKKYKNIYTQS